MTRTPAPIDRPADGRASIGGAAVVCRGAVRRIGAAPDLPLAAAVLLGLAAMLEVVFRAPGGAAGGGLPGGDVSTSYLSTALLLGLCATAPLALTRVHVLATALTITMATTVTLWSGHRLTVAALGAQLSILYLLGLRRPRRMVLPVVLPFAAYAVVAPTGGDVGDRRFAVVVLALVAGAVVLGASRRARREAAGRDASRQTLADTLLEHAARGERARIARELHDVVAHHISMIAVLAETARLATPGMPAEGEKHLLAISDTARAALTEMRRLLGVLREDAGAEPNRRPQPGLGQLNDLIDEARDSSGSSTRLIVYGHVVPLDPGVGLTAYRIVQEALTNARRHAPGAAVDVEVDYAETELRLRIRDNGPGPARRRDGEAGTDAGDAGHGLVGMRERAGMVGGTLSAGPAPGCGFVVEAALPTTWEAAE